MADKEPTVTDQGPRVEEFQVTGDTVVSTIKQLLREGSIRRITLKNPDGQILIEIPLTLGVAGVLLFPVWAAVGALAAVAAKLTIVVEKNSDEPPAE